MPDRIDPQLVLTLQYLAPTRPEVRLPFLVTLAPGALPSEVLRFAPAVWVERTRLAAGEMTARQALDLAADSRVERVEFDGTADALTAWGERRT
jgi:hypothetical protein